VTDPPTGTVTFLFTDIEGSTKLWERDPQAMADALARHDELLRVAIEDHGGYVFKTVGDAFCAAFGSASDALGAALGAQRALLGEGWAEEVRAIRVRMALHSGEAEEREGDYFGPPVNRVARLLSAGHGGQVLLSQAAQELTQGGLPEGASLRDLGERRLKDLFKPERVFQLVVADLPSSFPPLRTLDARPNNLPRQPTPLVGREKELFEIAGFLRRPEVRLLTLTGPGGTGKTRLSLQTAAELLDEFDSGVFFVALAPISDPELVSSAIAGPLGVRESAELTLTEALKEYLRDKEFLLVLDNFEQVVGAAPLVGELLAACPHLKVLATSRGVLKVYGEHEYAVPPLSLPDPRRLPPLRKMGQYESVRLFVERARAAQVDFDITNESAPAVAEICVRLDGLPLAIELAAARTKILTPQAMLSRLSSRMRLLKGGARNLPERQRTLRGAIDWSYDLLEEVEQLFFRRLSVFVGGFALGAAEEVCGADGGLDLDAGEGAQSLLAKGLLRRQEEEGAEEGPRFYMLETIREYAAERLEESGETEAIRGPHAEHYLGLAEEAEPELRGAHQLGWFERLEAEHDNLRAALSWAIEGGRTDTALRLGGALWWFWLVQGHLSEGRRWLEEALAKDDGRQAGSSARSSARSSVRAKALIGAGRLLLEQSDLERATALLEEGVELLRGVGHKGGLADALDNLGIARAYGGDLERAKALFEESVELFREAGDGWGVAEVLNNLALTAGLQGEKEQVMALHEESLRIRRELGDERGIAMSLGNLAAEAMRRGDSEGAAQLCEEGLPLARGLGDKGLTAMHLGNLGVAILDQGDPERATELLAEAIAIGHELGDTYHLHGGLMNLAQAAGAAGEALREARLFGAAQGLRESAGMSLLELEAREDLERPVATARSQVEEEAWERAWEEGRAMDLDEAISYATHLPNSSMGFPPSPLNNL
jgi:predicted ATPase/class 3 adenylate cyclase